MLSSTCVRRSQQPPCSADARARSRPPPPAAVGVFVNVTYGWPVTIAISCVMAALVGAYLHSQVALVLFSSGHREKGKKDAGDAFGACAGALRDASDKIREFGRAIRASRETNAGETEDQARDRRLSLEAKVEEDRRGAHEALGDARAAVNALQRATAGGPSATGKNEKTEATGAAAATLTLREAQIGPGRLPGRTLWIFLSGEYLLREWRVAHPSSFRQATRGGGATGSELTHLI